MMNITAVQEFIVHFGIGFGLCIVLVIYCSNQNKRRRAFRFGGDSPLNFGTKTRWISWFILAYIFEFATSLHPGIGAKIYIEMALSLYQACAFTLGLFVSDRLGMMFEPASFWVVEVSKDVSDAKAMTEGKPEKIWIKETVDDVTGSFVESARDATDSVVASANSTLQNGRGVIHDFVASIHKKKQDELRKREEAEANERKRLSEYLKGY